jgi:hypothetical protein
MKKHLNKILGLGCLSLAAHSAYSQYVQFHGLTRGELSSFVALAIVGLELVLIRHKIHKP